MPTASATPPSIRWLSAELRERFGGRIVKVPLDAGFTCPNRDGTLGMGGCAWCDPGGSGPDGAERALPWQEALQRGAARAVARSCLGVLAYFQAYSNTHGSPRRLRQVLQEALAVPGVLGLAVGTRPDCLGEEILAVLDSFNRQAYFWVEVGMQTRHDATLRAMNRGHNHGATVGAVEALRARGIRTVLHLILGIPGETPDMMRHSLDEAARLRPWGVKLHPFHVVRGSALEETWRRGDLSLLDLRDYTALACDGLERFHPEAVVHRLTGERPEGVLLAPDWCRGKGVVLDAIRQELGRRGTSQGSRWR